MSHWEGKSKGTPLGYRIFISICRHLGLRPAYGLLRFVAAYYWLFSWRSSREIFSYFRNRLEYPWYEALVAVYRNYYAFGQTLLDRIVVMAGLPNRFTYTFDGEEYLHEMVRQGRGGILLGAHVGNWEAAGHLLQRLKTQVNIVMYDNEHRRIKQYLDQVIGARTFNIIVIDQDLTHAYKISEALSRNELICLLADRFLPGNKTTPRTFLGAPAEFPTGPFLLASGCRVPVSIVFAFKENDSHYHFYGSSLLSRGEQADRVTFAGQLMDIFVDELEQKINMYPAQWFNYHKFWSN